MQEMLDVAPFGLNCVEKGIHLTKRLKELTIFHYEHCDYYKRIIDTLNFNVHLATDYKQIPFLPVRLFKETDFLSIPRDDVFKIMTSSGTTGQAVSKIYLNKQTARNQQKVLVKIVSDFTEGSRLPMLIIDCPSVIKERTRFSARGAGILGFSIFGADKTYALDDGMNLNLEAVNSFLDKHKGKPILLFGFTYIIWKHFYIALKSMGQTLNLSQGILIHGGGWKKLLHEAVSKEDFKEKLKAVCGIQRVHDYYGMVEQTGSIYMECEEGHLHTSHFSDIIIRDPLDFSECEIGKNGLIQAVSVIPESYAGHSLLTEDEGRILGIDNCSCGRMGAFFEVLGRIRMAEVRGCSDTYEKR